MKHVGNLTYTAGSKHSKKRVGRGQGSGYGGHTAGRGHKGQKSRSGATIGIAFEGGQMPINRRVPKFGFTNKFRVEYQVLNVAAIEELVNNKIIDANDISFDGLVKVGLLNKNLPFKVLGTGEIKKAIKVSAHKFSKSAVDKIEAAGGTVEVHG